MLIHLLAARRRAANDVQIRRRSRRRRRRRGRQLREAEGKLKVVEIARTPDGLTLASAPLQFGAAQAPGRRTGETRIDIGLLGDGEFIARAIVKSGANDTGRAFRPFVIKKRQP